MKKMGFTLAEILITLAIIGIVSALVIPSVLKNYNDKKYNTARLKALKTFGEAGKMASINGEINGQPTARAFVENVLSKYLKITKVCDTAEECGFPSQIQPSNLNANKITSNNIKSWNNLNEYNYTKNNWTDTYNATKFSTYASITDGYSAKIFYNPKCVRDTHDNPNYVPCNSKECETKVVDDACINVIYDMNGVKFPNHVGEDIGFVTVFWSGLNSIATTPGIMPYNKAKEVFDEGGATTLDAQTRCAQKNTNKEKYTLPNVDEISSLVLNSKFSSAPNSSYLWSRTPVLHDKGYNWNIIVHTRSKVLNYYRYGVWCVKE